MTFTHWFSIVIAAGVAFTGSVGSKHGNLSPEGRELQRRQIALQTWSARKTDKTCFMTCQQIDAMGCRRWVMLCKGDAGWPPK